jgi:hypothetical protein
MDFSYWLFIDIAGLAVNLMAIEFWSEKQVALPI